MRPRTEDEPLPAPALQAEIVRCRRQCIGIPPRRHMHTGGGTVTFVIPLHPDPKLLPERVKRAVRPLLEQVRLVVGMMPQRRMPRFPRHAGKPIADETGAFAVAASSRLRGVPV